jgi:exopolyphosphatase/guanosine-5'-triphosphate,3'-diphosphate pyrophosphatase
MNDELFVKQLISLRLAVLLCHARQLPEHQSVKLAFRGGAFKLTTNPGWAKRYPQSAWLLGEEVQAWQKTAWKFSADLR